MVHLHGTAGSLTSACLLLVTPHPTLTWLSHTHRNLLEHCLLRPNSHTFLLTPHPTLTWLSHTHKNLLEHGLLRPNSHSPNLVCQYFAAHHATELWNKIHVRPLTSVQTWGWIWFLTHCRRQGSSRWPWWCGRCLPNSPAGCASACCLGTARGISEKNHRASGNGVFFDRHRQHKNSAMQVLCFHIIPLHLSELRKQCQRCTCLPLEPGK